MRVRPILEKDWESCWKVQHESHSSEKKFSADTWLFICKNIYMNLSIKKKKYIYMYILVYISILVY